MTIPLVQSFGFNSFPQLPTLDYRTFVNNATDLTSYSFSSVDIGAAASDRLLILAVHKAGANLTGVTVDGTAATLAASAGDCSFWTLRWPTGTTATIAVALSSAPRNMSVGVWRAIGLQSFRPCSVASQAGANPATSLSANLNIPAGGFGIWVLQRSFGTTGGNSWTGATERYDTQVDGTPETPSGADITVTTTETAHTGSVSFPSTNGSVILGVSFR